MRAGVRAKQKPSLLTAGAVEINVVSVGLKASFAFFNREKVNTLQLICCLFF